MIPFNQCYHLTIKNIFSDLPETGVYIKTKKCIFTYKQEKVAYFEHEFQITMLVEKVKTVMNSRNTF